jgi:hypothetical protein
MKTITEIIGGAQSLLDVNFDLQGCFEEYLTDEYKAFLHILRVAEQFIPSLHRYRNRIGRPPYEFFPFIRSMLGKSFFGIEKRAVLFSG